MSGVAGTAVCEAFIEALGLKTLFSALMGKVTLCLSLPPLISVMLTADFSRPQKSRSRTQHHQLQKT